MPEQEPTIYKGKIVYIPAIGYHIQPKDDDHAVVNFPGDSEFFEKLPEGVNLNDEVDFTLEENRIAAKTMRVIKNSQQ